MTRNCPQLRLAYYGDDFTGSTDVMEVLQWAGLNTLLFLEPPTPAQLSKYADLQAIGVAGRSRSMSPTEMEYELPAAFEKLKETGAPIVHYKTCSTFDSSPRVGSIGKAFELGQDIFENTTVPLLIGAPQLGRYSVFGNLFARSGLDSQPFRLDRHPTMTQHPVTPMTEADLRLHLGEQTNRDIALFDVNALQANDPDSLFRELLCQKPAGILFDILYPDHLVTIGSLIDSLASNSVSLFAVGSSGIEYALTSHWPSHETRNPPSTFTPVKQLLVVSGSCSPVTQRQNQVALDHGFAEVSIATNQILDDKSGDVEIERCRQIALEELRNGRNVLLHTAMGPNDKRIDTTNQILQQQGYTGLDAQLRSGRILGMKLGQLLKRTLAEHPLPRIGIAGGDTSGCIARELGITALRATAPLAPGSPLCTILADGPLNDTEVVFKGGQVGHPDVWLKLLLGTEKE